MSHLGVTRVTTRSVTNGTRACCHPTHAAGRSRAHALVIDRPPSGAGGGEVMPEKRITPQAPEKADSSATKTAAARVSKKKLAKKKLAKKKLAK
jgi:hypothetical protein